MSYNLEELHITISQAAIAHGLIVFHEIPAHFSFGIVIMNEDWQGFLSYAKQAGAQILYLKAFRYDPKQIIAEIDLEETENNRRLPLVSSKYKDLTSEREWLQKRLEEVIEPWNTRRDKISTISGLWIKDGIGHRWEIEADWFVELDQAIDAAVQSSIDVERENRKDRSQEEARRIHEFALKMVRHPRFSEATSQEKREYMASQLYPEAHRFEVRDIALRASLIYWWEFEPGEKAKTKERIKDLYSQGETIRNIAAVLKITEARVKQAITE